MSSYSLQNMVKLHEVVHNTSKKLKENETLITNGITINTISPNKARVFSFNTLIASGYNVICYENKEELIKTNFDYCSNNKDVLLDFNMDMLNKLVSTNQTDKQGRLI